MKRSIAMKLFLVVFVSMLMIVPMFSVDNGATAGTSNTHSLPSTTDTVTHTTHSTPIVTKSTQSAPKDSLMASLMDRLKQSPHSLTPLQTSSTSGKLYKVTFKEHNLTAGIPWKVGIINDTTSLSIFNGYTMAAGFYGDAMNISVFQTVNSTTSTSISLELRNGTYCYLAGPGNTYTNYHEFQVSGMAKSINVSFPKFYRVTISEKNLTSGVLWNSLVLSQTNGLSYYYNLTGSTSMVTYLPNGTYGFLSGPQSLYIFQHSFTVNGKNISVTVNFPEMYKVTFKETNLDNGFRWFIEAGNNNDSAVYLNSSYSTSMVAYMPEGNYTYQDNYVAFVGENKINEVISLFEFGESPNEEPFTVSDRSSTISVTFPKMYKVSFTEYNAPSDLSWGLFLSKSNDSISAENYSHSSKMVAYLPNGTYKYTPELGAVSYPGGNFTVNGSSLSVQVIFPVTYKVTFTETNVPTGVCWYINLNNNSISYYNSTSSTSMVAYLPNGTYYYIAYYYSGIYVSTSEIAFTVNGTSLPVHVIFPVTYKVTFTETNVPTGVSWSINLNNKNNSISYYNSTSSTSMVAYLPNGTYYYIAYYYSGRYVSTSEIAFTVNGTSLPVHVIFPVTYKVTFTESGLPSGTSWSVTLNGTTESSTTSTIVFSEINGTYSYTINSVSGYTVSSSSGSVTVNGKNAAQSVTFTSVKIPVSKYNITFTETGLPSGTAWYVNLTNGMSSGAITGTSYSFLLSNNSYTYTVSTSNHIYKLSAYSGSVIVDGKSVSESVTFKAVTCKVTFTETGLPSGSTWILVFNGHSYTLVNTSYSFQETNGTYSYSATSTDYKNLSGSVTVNGASKAVDLSFTLQTYKVTFSESGLPKGTAWYVNLTNGMKSGPITSSYSFNLANGTYTYITSHVQYYYSSNGTFTVDGPYHISVNYLKYPHLELSVTPLSSSVCFDWCKCYIIGVGSIP